MNKPYCIDELRVPEFNGVIGISSAPGLDGHSVDEDIKIIKKWGASLIITLIEDFEFQFYGITDLNNSKLQSIPRLSLPIKDGSVPDHQWDRRWITYSKQIHQLLDGKKVFIHCIGGRGRSGTVAAILLIEYGWEPSKAISEVRKVRPGAIENYDQAQYIYQYADNHNRKAK
jgi:ADP-ribosyl-[dinitrogen reductase] hydrolase